MAVLGRLCTDPEVGLMVEHRDKETVPWAARSRWVTPTPSSLSKPLRRISWVLLAHYISLTNHFCSPLGNCCRRSEDWCLPKLSWTEIVRLKLWVDPNMIKCYVMFRVKCWVQFSDNLSSPVSWHSHWLLRWLMLSASDFCQTGILLQLICMMLVAFVFWIFVDN